MEPGEAPEDRRAEPGLGAAGDPGSGAPAGSEAPGAAAQEALRHLEERLNRASEAAERVFTEAAESAARTGRKPPPAGWQPPEDERGAGARAGQDDLELLVGVLDSLRDLIPPELQRRLAAAVREMLLAVRALIDWYLERSEQQRTKPTEVEDIPIL